jgi:hypothetical protein
VQFLRLLACRGGERELEIVILRHQVAILRRGGRRPQYTAVVRALLAAVSTRAMDQRTPALFARECSDGGQTPGAQTSVGSPSGRHTI